MENYDYIVVGAGSAGCVLAARLSEDSGVRVLVLESGGEDSHPQIATPPLWPTLWGSDVDYAYDTVAQRGGLRHAWPRGHTLGGSGSINAMVYLRGHPSDFDLWAAQGCAGWDHASVLPYFMRMESVPAGDPDHRGRGGPLRPAPVARAEANPLSEVFVHAAAAAGHPVTEDFNGARSDGAGWHDLSITDGRRQSAALAYLHPARTRNNLTVATGARTHRLLFRGHRCVGVEYRQGGRTHRAHAGAEVILSAGAVDSPRLLLLSGVGPAAELAEVGIPVHHDLPGVGRNLHDHPLCGVVCEAAQPIPAGRTNLAETSMAFRSDPALDGPDMQLMFIHVPFHPPHLAAPANSFTVAVTMVPDSRGTIRLAGPDPQTPPLIDPAYLAEESDVERMLYGLDVARQILATTPFRAWHAGEILPGAAVVDRKELRDYVFRATGTYYHPVGSCAMGTGAEAVVDPELAVHGLEGLRIADASIMPRIVGVNTNAATMMIAEKAAAMITEAGKG